MASRVILGAKRADETRSEVFDFTSRLAASETISTATVTATVYTGTDPTPGTIISGAASISGARVTQKVTGGRAGVIYLLNCAAVTSTSQTLILEAFMPVMPAGY